MVNLKVTCNTLAVILVLTTTVKANADITLSGLFSDNMVLQRGVETKVWGYADNGENVTVEFNGQQVQTTTENGKWMLKLKNLTPGGPYKMVIKGKNIIELNNILVGDVWVGSGQSNMAWTMSKTSNAAFDVANSTNPLIRLFTVPRKSTGTELEFIGSKWNECLPSTVHNFSGVAYFFGKNMVDATKVPVGLINSSVGGTPAEAWMSKNELTTNPVLVEDYKKLVELENTYLEVKSTFTTTEPVKKKPAVGGSQKQSVLYNGMIAPLLDYTIKGVIWYQGEANRKRKSDYGRLLTALITSWRQAWNIGDFPFLM
ncbi:MAG: sialate O-acetylesterase, partial [Elusimicrobiota bacterium]